LLTRLHDYGVPITTASDTHELADLGYRVADLTAAAQAAGYSKVTAFSGRNQTSRPL
jgi:hypothetical protein